MTVTRFSDAHELYKVIEAAQAGLLEQSARDRRAPASAARSTAVEMGQLRA